MGRYFITTIVTLMILLGELTTALAAIPEFVTTPTSVNATLGSTATFNCSVSSGSVAWIVNGSLLSHQITPDITTSGGGTTSSLHVPAREKYNNMNVTCIVFTRRHDLSDDLRSGPAVLRIQGLLDAVNNLRNESLGPVIHLTWDAPFTLDITGVDPDIWYHIDITVNNGPFNNSSDSIPFNTYFVNTPEFNFTNNGTNTSVIYQFRVTPINGAGNGTTSAPVTGYFGGPPRRITTEMVVVETSAEPLSVNFTITLGNNPPGEMPDRFQVHAETNDGGDKVLYSTDDIRVTPDSDGRVFVSITDWSSFKAYRKYNATITAKNNFGEGNSTGQIPFSTHEVQTCEANNCSAPGTVNINCNFTENSKAKGYLTILCPRNNSSQETFVVANRTDMSSSTLNISVPGIPPNDYTVIVYDLRSDGLPPVLSGGTNHPAEEENVTVINPGSSENNDLFSVNGTLLHVPDISSTEVKLCVSFESSNKIVVLAHRYGDPKKLLAYFLNTTNCTTAPAAGYYIVAVFTQTSDNILAPTTTPPTISFYEAMNITSPVPPVLPKNTYDSPLLLVVGTVTVAVSTLLVTVTVVVTVAVCVKTKVKKEKLKKCEIEMLPNQAYETVSKPCPSKSATQIHTERCIAYDDVVVQACN